MLALIRRRTFATTATPNSEFARHVTPDGRTSLKKYLFGGRNVFALWWSKITPDTYPVLAGMLGVTALATWFGTRSLLKNPDVKINKVQRTKTIRDNFAEGKAWIQHHKSIRGDGFFGKKDSA